MLIFNIQLAHVNGNQPSYQLIDQPQRGRCLASIKTECLASACDAQVTTESQRSDGYLKSCGLTKKCVNDLFY